MKQITTFFLVILSYQLSFAQIIESSCEAIDSITMLYEFDAKVLAARQMQGDPVYANTTIVDEDITNFHLKNLLAVYNATNFAAGDSVTKCLSIHTFPEAVLNGFLMGLDNTQEWVQALEQGMFPTGYDLFDSLYQSMELEITNIFDFSSSIAVVFQSENCLHLEGIVNTFSGLDAVNYVEPDYYFGDGNNITASIENGFTDYIYEHGWGDCPAGCIFSHFWQIRVYDDCSVEFIDSWGDPVDFPCEPMIIDDTEEQNKDTWIKVFPTVTSDFVTIQIGETNLTNTHLSIHSIDGRLIDHRINLQSNNLRLDVSGYSNGLHFITLNTNNQVVTKLFFKI